MIGKCRRCGAIVLASGNGIHTRDSHVDGLICETVCVICGHDVIVFGVDTAYGAILYSRKDEEQKG